MGKMYTGFQTKTAQKTFPMGGTYLYGLSREDKGEREGIPYTHPIPQVMRLELFLESG